MWVEYESLVLTYTEMHTPIPTHNSKSERQKHDDEIHQMNESCWSDAPPLPTNLPVAHQQALLWGHALACASIERADKGGLTCSMTLMSPLDRTGGPKEGLAKDLQSGLREALSFASAAISRLDRGLTPAHHSLTPHIHNRLYTHRAHALKGQPCGSLLVKGGLGEG